MILLDTYRDCEWQISRFTDYECRELKNELGT